MEHEEEETNDLCNEDRESMEEHTMSSHEARRENSKQKEETPESAINNGQSQGEINKSSETTAIEANEYYTSMPSPSLYAQLTDTRLLLSEMSSMQLGPAVMSRYMLDTSAQSRGAASGITKSLAKNAENNQHESFSLPTTTTTTTTTTTKKTTRSKEPGKRVFQYKVILLGHQEVGKTSLRKCFESEPYFFKRLPDVKTTSGVEVAKQHYYIKKDAVDLTLADFAGQESYHSHTYFLTQRSLFILVWKISAIEQDFQSSGINESEEERLCMWIAEVYAKYPSAQLVLVATHLDELRVQGQRSVEMILTRVERKLQTFLDHIIHATNNISQSTIEANESRQSGITPIKCRFVGNFAVSCKTRQIIAAGNAHRMLSGSKISALARLLAEVAHDECLHDTAYPEARIPASHDRFIHVIEGVKRTYTKRLLMQLSEFALLAQNVGITNEAELLRVAKLMHACDIIYLIHQFNLSSNVYIVLRPEWLSRMSASLFSFAHILHTPLHLRSSISRVSYLVSHAEHADMSLMSKGYLRWPLARLLFESSLKDLTHNHSYYAFFNTSSVDMNVSINNIVDDVDVAMCLHLLQSMEIIYPVLVKCDDASIVNEETPQEKRENSIQEESLLPINTQNNISKTNKANQEKLATKTTTTTTTITSKESEYNVVSVNDELQNNTITRYFVPSLAPKLMPVVLRRLAPILLHHGVRLQMEFNLLPDELWWRLQARMHSLLHLVTMYQPLGSIPETTWEEEMMLLEEYRLKEADEEHNRWRDAMWLSSSTCRVLVYREGRSRLAVFTAETISHGAELVLQTLEDHLLELLQEYAGVTRAVYVACPSAECSGWVEASVIMLHDKVECPVCHKEFENEAFLSSENKKIHEQRFPQNLLKETSTLLSSCLTPTSSEYLCRYLGIPFIPEENIMDKEQLQNIEQVQENQESTNNNDSDNRYSNVTNFSTKIETHDATVSKESGDSKEETNMEILTKNKNDNCSNEVHTEYLRALDKVIQAALFKALVERTEVHARLKRMIEITPSQVIF